MKTYEIYWTEMVEYCATVHADSPEEALEAFHLGEYDDIDQTDSEMTGDYSVEEQ